MMEEKHRDSASWKSKEFLNKLFRPFLLGEKDGKRRYIRLGEKRT
jgi:hypothetical protein